jgi:anti-anti-sigma factor
MTTTSTFQIDRLASAEGPVVLRLRGDLDYATAPRLREYLAQLEGTRLGLVIELRWLRMLDSSGLAVLLQARTAAERRGGALGIRGAQGIVRRVLERTGTLTILSG